MAVIKGNYVRRGAKAKARAKATIRYIQSRPGKDGEKLTRELFGSDGVLARQQAFRMIDEAKKGTLFYRLVLAPDPKTEDNLRDLDLRDLTTALMLRLEERLKAEIPFAAAEHNDHSPHRHVHIVALLDRKLSKQDLEFLRTAAADAILQQRRIRQLTLTRALSRGQGTKQISPQASSKSQRHQSSGSDRQASADGPTPGHIAHACPNCLQSAGDEMQKLSRTLYRCNTCGFVYRDTGMGMQIESTGQSLGLGRSLL